jgi:hypothetical protein
MDQNRQDLSLGNVCLIYLIHMPIYGLYGSESMLLIYRYERNNRDDDDHHVNLS